jgi:hypothetical protein
MSRNFGNQSNQFQSFRPTVPPERNRYGFQNQYAPRPWCDVHQMYGHTTLNCKQRIDNFRNFGQNSHSSQNLNQYQSNSNFNSYQPSNANFSVPKHPNGASSKNFPGGSQGSSQSKSVTFDNVQANQNGMINDVINFINNLKDQPKNVLNADVKNEQECSLQLMPTETSLEPIPSLYPNQVTDSSTNCPVNSIGSNQQYELKKLNDRVGTRKMTPAEEKFYDYEVCPPLKLPIVVGNHVVFALCDTGAQSTLITTRFMKVVFDIEHQAENPIATLKAANKQPVHVYGTVRFPVTIGKDEFYVKACVASELSTISFWALIS